MPDQSRDTQYKEYANKIVGIWYNRIPHEILIFSFLDNLPAGADLFTKHNGAINKATYNFTFTPDNQCYLQIWSTEGKKNGTYRIEILTPSMLTVSNSENNIATYQRKVDYNFANEVLDNFAN